MGAVANTPFLKGHSRISVREGRLDQRVLGQLVLIQD